MSHLNVLLLTGTIAPCLDVSKIGYRSSSLDPQSRVKEYFDTLVFYISQSDFEAFVFCENSNYSFEREKGILLALADYYGKQIEFLQFNGNHEKTLEKGYGYGEGECIDYAFDHSELLKKTNSWYKLTGRYIYENINQLLASSKNMENLFFRWMRPLAFFCLSSAFFKVSNQVYKKYLYNLKENLNLTQTIEAEFYLKLRNTEVDCGKLFHIPKRRKGPTTLITYWYHYVLLCLGAWNMNTSIGKILDRFFYKGGLKNKCKNLT